MRKIDKLGFDNWKCLELQSAHIREQIYQFGNKLYLEFGGKLFDDYHVSRVLPGFEPDNKIRMLKELRGSVEVVIAICTNGIEKDEIRGDLDITYDVDVLRLIDAFRGEGLLADNVAITQYAGRFAANAFRHQMEYLGVQTCLHYPIVGYPHNTGLIVSDRGYGKNDYIETGRSLVMVTAPSPGGGKMAVCLSQLYHSYKQRIRASYAKFETFPIWNLPLQHPVDLAYEAATVDLGDVDVINPFHLATYGETTVNYDQDVGIFPVPSAMFERIMGEYPYKSPADIGVNMAGKYTVDDGAVCAAAQREIIHRYYTALCDRQVGAAGDELVSKLELLIQQTYVDPSIRPVVTAAAQAAEETGSPAGAIELLSDEVVTGKTTDLIGTSFATLFNALKCLASIDHQHRLISQEAIEPIQAVKVNRLDSVNPRLHSDGTLIALAISATTNPLAERALNQFSVLRRYEAHSTVTLSPVDSSTYSRLDLRLTCEPQYETNRLYHK